MIERAGVAVDRAPHHGPISRSPGESSMNLSNISEDRLSLAVQLAKRDVKRRKEQGLLGDHPSSKSTSPSRARKSERPLVSKGILIETRDFPFSKLGLCPKTGLEDRNSSLTKILGAKVFWTNCHF